MKKDLIWLEDSIRFAVSAREAYTAKVDAYIAGLRADIAECCVHTETTTISRMAYGKRHSLNKCVYCHKVQAPYGHRGWE